MIKCNKPVSLTILLHSLTRTLNNGEQDDDDEEEEGDVKDDTVELVLISIRSLDLITDATTSPYTLVQVEHEALQGYGTKIL